MNHLEPTRREAAEDAAKEAFGSLTIWEAVELIERESAAGGHPTSLEYELIERVRNMDDHDILGLLGEAYLYRREVRRQEGRAA